MKRDHNPRKEAIVVGASKTFALGLITEKQYHVNRGDYKLPRDT